MKQFFLTAFAAVTLLACSGDDSVSPVQNDSILGAWRLQASSLNNQDFTLSNCQQKNTVKFTDNGRVEFTYYLGSSACTVDAVEKGDWTKDGNNVTISWDDSDAGKETYYLTVTDLSATSLKWSTNISGEGNLKETYQKQ
ncbi:hypothetical protein AMR72_08630 [Flavobacterium psychrophilum]|nr:hypothetical protein AMR72_08630 [Flavobacterium psychrophilum]AOE52564.1 hypothetical protein ALW18_08620 [Flavobacterium psychrophilum]